MERAIEAGASVLIENMAESIDAVLNPIITRSTFKKGRSLYVKLGDKDVEYNPKFRLVLHTKLSNPHYPPEIQAETTLINFTVTENGLEDQLLALAVNKERPDLEATKTALVKQNTEFTIRLKQLEDDLLMRLSTAEGDLTEDVALIESLEESKRIADDISAKARPASCLFLPSWGAPFHRALVLVATPPCVLGSAAVADYLSCCAFSGTATCLQAPASYIHRGNACSCMCDRSRRRPPFRIRRRRHALRNLQMAAHGSRRGGAEVGTSAGC